MATLLCKECNEPLTSDGLTWSTLVGYWKDKNGHTHDDNCQKRVYRCKNGHEVMLSKRRTCSIPGCDWKGKEACFCHEGKKLDKWPEEA